MQAHFTPHLFEFLLELRANNDRAWFQDNKGRYEQHVKEPLLQFIADFDGKLQSISEHFVADTRTNGGYPLVSYSVIGILLATWT